MVGVVRAAGVEELDEVALEGGRVGEEDVVSHAQGHHEVDELRRYMAEREETDEAAVADLLGSVDLHGVADGVSDPGVVVVADHHCLRRASGAASVDEGGTVARLLHLHPPLQSLLLPRRLIAA